MIVLHGDPRSTNHIWKHSCNRGYMHSYMTPAGKALKNNYQKEARTQWKRKPLTDRIQVGVTLFYGTRRKVDIDNGLKIALDSLTGIVWIDDTQIDELNIRRGYDKERPRIELEVNALP